ncbi:uncharacterized protein MELLADRAFT_114625 [Melampsora larici-populina 98AG31]|uniref:Poly A polymerase head domain-containing protein n=1 Tax=Melampsora larici-populina (strain 98AG31 / pathotype 3-4-7) TaxID=747676 RepID=F4SE65_MELLP|nr:uncharacterized protein MELLADRAFT_114625 [Melampsora larici-populina 98AG31]EGF97062.1 hypothetical protein MELLADRAFT_114625 [Melampsora larici-populina 98AG31]
MSTNTASIFPSYPQVTRFPNINPRFLEKRGIGTPKEDAMRCDITINELFYNMHNDQIEDQTELGLEDLKNGLIRTPLPALETFKDDPLRLLSCIRFSSRFGFQLDDQIIQAAQSDQITFVKVKQRENWVGEFIISESIKFSNYYKTTVSHLFHSIELIEEEMKHQKEQEVEESYKRLRLGQLLRSNHVHDLNRKKSNQEPGEDLNLNWNWKVTLVWNLVYRIGLLDSIDRKESSDLVGWFNDLMNQIDLLNLSYTLTQEFDLELLNVE